MLMDNQLLLWDAAALSTDAASTNTVDLGAAGNDISRGEPMALVITVDVAAKVSGGTEDYTFQVIQSASADLSSPDNLAMCLFTTARATTYLAAGKQVCIPIPPGSITKRYIGAYFDGSNTPTITVTASFMPLANVQKDAYFAAGYTIS